MVRSSLARLAPLDTSIRAIAAVLVLAPLLFLIDNTLIFWFDWPGLRATLSGSGPSSEGALLGWVEMGIVIAAICAGMISILASLGRTLQDDAEFYTSVSAFIVRAAFWAIFLVGLVDMAISFLRVEGLLASIAGKDLATQLGRSVFRGTWVHTPLILASVVIASFSRTLGFTWLALLIVIAEFGIVICRFVFSYEQAFMGDLVRFWYAGLFLFASAYTLVHDGHVRVDVLYSGFSERGKALANIFGSLLLGLPLCWNILIQGMSGRGSSINSPLLSFEISQSGFGMYTKYLMAAYLVVFAVSMAIQFVSFILSNIARLRDTTSVPDTVTET